MASKGKAAAAAKTKRPAQIVLTMEASLKKQVAAKAKHQKLAVTEIGRELLRQYVDGKITITVEAEPEPTVAAAPVADAATTPEPAAATA